MSNVLHTLLRDATHQQHVGINRHPLIEGLTKPGFPLANYLVLLRSYAALYRAIEPAIDLWLASESSLFSYSQRHKLPWILEDLAYFETEPLKTLQPRVPDIDSWGSFIGILYAVEGSTLGGQIISRSLNAHLGLEKESGGRFFFGYGDATRLMWDEFMQFAGTVVTDQSAMSDARDASQVCFGMFERALDEAQRHLAALGAETSAISR